MEIAQRDQEALRVHADGQLRKSPGRRTEYNPGSVRSVKSRLVARAQDVMGGLLIESRRATNVRTDLGIGDDVVDRPVQVGRRLKLTRTELDDDRCSLCHRVIVVQEALRAHA